MPRTGPVWKRPAALPELLFPIPDWADPASSVQVLPGSELPVPVLPVLQPFEPELPASEPAVPVSPGPALPVPEPVQMPEHYLLQVLLPLPCRYY